METNGWSHEDGRECVPGEHIKYWLVFHVQGLTRLNIGWSWDYDIFIMGILTLVRWHFHIETAPWSANALDGLVVISIWKCHYSNMRITTVMIRQSFEHSSQQSESCVTSKHVMFVKNSNCGYHWLSIRTLNTTLNKIWIKIERA